MRYIAMPVSFFFLLTSAALSSIAQEPGDASPDNRRIVQIIRSDRLTIVRTQDQTESYILAGNVELLQGSTRFFCDSAVKDERRNMVEAFGSIHINDADSVHTYAQQLTYMGESRVAVLRKKVRLTDGKGILTTDELQYSVAEKTGTYDKGGKLVNGNSVLTSKYGVYKADTKEAFFHTNVQLVDPEYTMATDTLRYNVDSETATFVSETSIRDGRTLIRTRSGYYELRTGKASFSQRPTIEDSTQFVIADQINYDKKSGAGIASGKVIYRDTVQGATILAGLTEFNNIDGRMLATQKPVMVMRQDGDSLFISADTLQSLQILLADTSKIEKQGIFSKTGIQSPDSNLARAPIASKPMELKALSADPKGDKKAEPRAEPDKTGSALTGEKLLNDRSTDSVRLFKAYHHVKIFSDSMQAICDSLVYASADSTFRLFKDPVLWARGSQISGDTILLYTKNQQPREVTVIENGFAASMDAEALFNQIRGNLLNGFFHEGSLERLRAKGSAESIYYLQDEDSSYFGLNHAKADAIWFFFLHKELKKVSWINGIEGVTYPFRQIPAEKKELPGFKWRSALRPKSRAELNQE